MKSSTVFPTGCMRVCTAFFSIFTLVTLVQFSSCLLVFFSDPFQRKCLPPMVQYGGQPPGNSWLMPSLTTRRFNKWSTPGTELSSILTLWQFHIQRCKVLSVSLYNDNNYSNNDLHNWCKFLSAFSHRRLKIFFFRSMNKCDLDSCPLPLQAGSSMTKVKLLVVDTADPSRRMHVAPPASVALGYVYISASTVPFYPWSLDAHLWHL